MAHLFSELDVAGVRLANRIVLPPMATEQADVDGSPEPCDSRPLRLAGGHRCCPGRRGALLRCPGRARFTRSDVAGIRCTHRRTCRHHCGDPRSRFPVRRPDQPCRFEPAGGDAREVPRPQRSRTPGVAPGPGGDVEAAISSQSFAPLEQPPAASGRPATISSRSIARTATCWESS